MGLELQGRRALVTGATGGIGNAIARALHAKGATVVVSARRKELLDELVADLGERAEAIPADLADAASVRALAEQAGDIDVLVANAALPASGNYDTFSANEVDRAIDVNLRAPMQLALALMPAMTKRGSGHMVFISSISGKVASGGASVYNGTKFGLRGWALGLRDDLRPSGVGVTTIFPGFIRDAGMFADSGADIPPGVRTRTPEQVAAAVIKGIEQNKGEIDVAPLSLRSGAIATALAPELLSKLQRKMGGEKVAQQLADGQADKR
jgi:short-subunit dehydrogenase